MVSKLEKGVFKIMMENKLSEHQLKLLQRKQRQLLTWGSTTE